MRFRLLKIFIFFMLCASATRIYAAPIKILIVPGHDNEIWGARYGNIKEADMNLQLATNIINILRNDERFEVHTTRGTAGYIDEFANYFANQKNEIISFRDLAKKARLDHITSGSFIKNETIEHNPVTEDISVILYGINKWANENNIDAVLHVHFNDYPRKTRWKMGKYKGFAIYVPDAQAAHSNESANLAGNVFGELLKKYSVSTYQPESAGIVFDQSLIALGSNGTLLPSIRSILVEYGYIYKFGSSFVRNTAYKSMAELTAVGIQNYFFPSSDLPAS